MTITEKLRPPLVILFALGAISLWLHGPIAQWASYHDFADKRVICSIPNFFDTVSNFFFLIPGIYLLSNLSSFSLTSRFERLIYTLMGLSLVALFFGSMYYHLKPDDARLVWDRLPIASFFSLLFLTLLFDLKVLKPSALSHSLSLLYWVLSSSSVFIWAYTQDLRMYAFAQFFPLVTILVFALVLWFDKSYRAYSLKMLILILGYTVAKIAESCDYQILSLSDGNISGHTVKHTIAGIAILLYFIKEKNSSPSVEKK